MSQYETDPTASTDKFRAFVDEEETAPGRPAGRSAVRIVAPVLVAVVLIAVVAWLLL